MTKNYKSHGNIKGVELKKKYGQHFLRDQTVICDMLKEVELNSSTSVFEIGCGAGVLTQAILNCDIARLWVFEIDPEWAQYVEDKIKDPRLKIFVENFLDVDLSILKPNAPWTLLANLPYVVTFPILYKLLNNIDLLKEGVIMIQEEVAQKIVKTSGRGYGYHSIYLQHYFDWKLLTKVPPEAFYPPPKVYSRLLYFKPRKILESIPKEQEFWEFIKRIFLNPRKTLKNNIKPYHYNLENISEETLSLRAQQLSKQQLIDLWKKIS